MIRNLGRPSSLGHGPRGVGWKALITPPRPSLCYAFSNPLAVPPLFVNTSDSLHPGHDDANIGASLDLNHKLCTMYSSLSYNMTLVAITGIKDPLRPGARSAVASYYHTGIPVKIITRKIIFTTRSIAPRYGACTTSGMNMEDPVSCALDLQVRIEVVPYLHVLASTFPEVKKVLVKALCSVGEIVSFTDGKSSTPTLKTADVEFSTGVAKTEVANASDSFLMGDTFTRIMTATVVSLHQRHRSKAFAVSDADQHYHRLRLRCHFR